MNIAIIGCGIGGIHTLKTIIDHPHYNENLHIHVFEKRDEFGVGIAYEDDTDYKLLNVHEEYVSLEIGNPHHIYKWLEVNPDKDIRIEGMLPRSVFGDYIKDTYKPYLNNDNVRLHNDLVIDITKNEDKYNISTENDTYKDFDAIFLNIGQPYYKDAYKLSDYDNFIRDPYPLEEKLDINKNKKLSTIDNDTTVGIIGTGPTSIDIYRYLRRNYGKDFPVYFFTHTSGFHPVEIPYEKNGKICSIDDNWIDENKDDEGFIDLDLIVETIRADFSKAGHKSLLDTYDRYKDTEIEDYKKAMEDNDKDLGFAQSYTMDLWVVAAKLYNSLSGLDRLDVDKNYLQKIDFLISKTPYETMKKLINDYDEGKIKIIRGTKDINVDANKKFSVVSKEHPDISTDIIINAQGFEKNLLKAVKNDKLLGNLYDHGFIEADVKEKYIRVTYPSYNLLNKKYGIMDNIYLGGMWAGATDILNNDLRSIIQASALMATDFMDKLSD